MQKQQQQFSFSPTHQFKKVLLIACLGITTSQPVYADFLASREHRGLCHPQGVEAGRHGSMGMPPHLRGIQLSVEQEDKIFAMMHAEMPKIHEDIKARQYLYDQLRILGQAEPYNEAEVKTLAEKLAGLERDAMINKTRMDHTIYRLLTPEQRKQLEKNTSEQRGEMIPSHLDLPFHPRRQNTRI